MKEQREKPPIFSLAEWKCYWDRKLGDEKEGDCPRENFIFRMARRFRRLYRCWQRISRIFSISC